MESKLKIISCDNGKPLIGSALKEDEITAIDALKHQIEGYKKYYNNDELYFFRICMDILPFDDLREQTYMGKPWVWFCNLDYFTKQEGDVFNIFENKMCKHEVYIPRKGIKKSDILSFGVLQ